MDYQRVYDEFIADRRGKPVPTGYTERHHILPRSLGGSDDADNLIDLTAEDHVRAHNMLARIHGGEMWFALNMMVGTRKIPSRRIRKFVEIARKRFAEEASKRMRYLYENGLEPHNKDQTVYGFKNVNTGEIFHGTRDDLRDYTGTKMTALTQMIIETVKSCEGWIINGRDENVGKQQTRGAANGNADKTTYVFQHVYGDTFVGTASDLRTSYEISPAGMTKIKKGHHCKGWFMEGCEPKLPIRGFPMNN